MVDFTICPLLFTCNKELSFKEINSYFFYILKNYIKYIDQDEYNLYLSINLYRYCLSLFPWSSYYEDDVLRQKIIMLKRSIIGPVDKHAVFNYDLENNNFFTSDDVKCQLCEDSTLCDFWVEWLNHFKNEITENFKICNGIATSCDICIDQDSLCNNFILLYNSNDFLYLHNPLFLYYASYNLPYTGDMYFVPPRKCKSAIPIGPNKGFLDNNGHEWKWDHLHYDHWNVYINKKNYYLNVTTDGYILSKKYMY